MNLFTKKKKGFTIVELVIVVAVIAVLAAILIPTFVGLVEKTRVTADNTLVSELNRALAIENSVKGGEKHKTMQDALNTTDEYGFNVSRINAKANQSEILWDSVNDVFCYFEGKTNIITYIPEYPKKEDLKGDYQYFVIRDVKTQADIDTKYSTYLRSCELTSIETTKGLDVGNETNVTSITYNGGTNAQDVVIRTNSANTSLTINAANDTVNHYDAVGSLNIVAVANASYHEYGKASFAEIKTGRIVLESKSEVEHIHLTKTGNDFVDITVAKASDVEMPDFSRDPVDLSAGSKLIVALQDGTNTTDAKDYVWLTEVGIYEQVTVSESKTNAGTTYATSDSVNAEKKETAQQIANNITFTSGNVDYKVTAKTTDNGATWTYEVVDNSGNVSEDYSAAKDTTENTVNVQTTGNNPETVETTAENGMTSEQKQAAKTEVVETAVEKENYKGDVYILQNGEALDTGRYATLAEFRDEVNGLNGKEANTFAGYTVTLQVNVDLGGAEWTPIGTSEHPFSGVFDGQNHEIKNYKIRGSEKNSGLALFGFIKGTNNTDVATFTKDTPLSNFYNTSTYTVYLPSEDVFTCVVKNLNVAKADVNTTADGWTAAVVAYVQNATVANVHLSDSILTATCKVGGIAGYLPDNYCCFITNCSTANNVTVTASAENHCTGILSRVSGTASHAIIANCTNNATISCAGVNGAGIAGQAKGVLYYNDTNNGAVTSGTRAAGIATDCSGSVFIGCTNTGHIKANNTMSDSTNSIAGIASYLASTGHNVIVNCQNSGKVEGTCAYSQYGAKIAGIVAGGVQTSDTILNNVNTGELKNDAVGGRVYDICNLSSVPYVVEPADLAALNAATATDNKYVKVTNSITLSNGNTIAVNGQEKLEFVNSPAYLTIDLTNSNANSFVIMVNNTTVTLVNGSGKVVTVSGKGNTVVVEAEQSIKSLRVSNEDAQVASSLDFAGTADIILLNGVGLVNAEVKAGATVGRVCFGGTGTFVLTNRGTISHKTEGQYGAEHTIDTITASNITIHNYGTIEAKKNSDDVCSYALLFYGGATVKFYAYEGSVVRQEKGTVMAHQDGSIIEFYYEDGTELIYYDSNYEYPDTFKYDKEHVTVTKMN